MNMKSKNITTIIAEGTDGVGKSELIMSLFKIYNYRYMVYHRGELSNLFYAQKYNRPFSATQVGLPFLHVLLICHKKVLADRIIKRGKELHQSNEEIAKELEKVNDQDEFIRLFNIMKKDYHMIMVDTTDLSIEEVGQKVAKMIDKYVANLEKDADISEWNERYRQACKKLNLEFSVRDNQPYINNVAIMAESTLHNGVFETFSDKTWPDNFIYSLAYEYEEKKPLVSREFDFSYIIFSKVKRRPEIYDYLANFMMNDKKCLVADNEYMPVNPLLHRMPRVFGDDFIMQIGRARATVYCARDLAPLRLQTARLYEAILANQIVFVDKYSDPDNEILRLMHKDSKIVDLLYVTPSSICENYDKIMQDRALIEQILSNQRNYYSYLKEHVKGGKF